MKLKSLFSYRKYLALFLTKNFAKKMDDEKYLKLKYYACIGQRLDLDNPKTFNEKLQWLKLHDRNPKYTTMVDKYSVKNYVADIIGDEYIIPTIGAWDSFEDIDFDVLPDKFVLKCTHDSGGLVICRDKSTFDMGGAREKIEKSLKRDYYLVHREWPYKDVPRRIIAEKYMEDAETSELRDYKFFCFGGICKALFIATERQKKGAEVKFDFFDTSFNHLDVRQGHPWADSTPQAPKRYSEMLTLAEKLSQDIPHVRVDFYEVNGKVYFGELTFSHFAGFVPFEPEEWDERFGSWIVIPDQK